MIVIEFEENKYGNINRRKEVIFMYGDWMELVPLDVQSNKNCNNNANKEEEEWI